MNGATQTTFDINLVSNFKYGNVPVVTVTIPHMDLKHVHNCQRDISCTKHPNLNYTATPGSGNECCCKKILGLELGLTYQDSWSEMIVLNDCTIEVVEYNT